MGRQFFTESPSSAISKMAPAENRCESHSQHDDHTLRVPRRLCCQDRQGPSAVHFVGRGNRDSHCTHALPGLSLHHHGHFCKAPRPSTSPLSSAISVCPAGERQLIHKSLSAARLTASASCLSGDAILAQPNHTPCCTPVSLAAASQYCARPLLHAQHSQSRPLRHCDMWVCTSELVTLQNRGWVAS